jgi:hypothetical protein
MLSPHTRKRKKKTRKAKNPMLTPHPNLRKTPRGGRMMARMMSMQVAVPMIDLPS